MHSIGTCNYKENYFLYRVNVFLSNIINWIYSAFILKRKVACELWFLKMHSLKPLSDCHEFSYDMRRVKNSPHVVGKSKRCRPVSSVLGTCRHISYIVGENLREFKRFKNLATTRRSKWAELFSDLITHP